VAENRKSRKGYLALGGMGLLEGVLRKREREREKETGIEREKERETGIEREKERDRQG
jgi:hypothetical protein